MKETFGPIKIGLTKSQVINILGQPSEKTNSNLEPATGNYLQTLNYKDEGIIITLSGLKEPDIVERITIKSPCKYKSTRNIGIENTRADVLAANKDGLTPENQQSEKVVVGSVYGGILFEFDNEKVKSIFIIFGVTVTCRKMKQKHF